MQSRACRINDVITSKEIDEIAELQPGAGTNEEGENRKAAPQEKPASKDSQAPQMSMAHIAQDGKVKIEVVEESKVNIR